MRYQVRQQRILARMMGGRAVSVDTFEDLRPEFGVTKKTVRRDLRILEDVPEFEVYSFNHHDTIYWKSSRKWVPDDAVPRSKKCHGHCGRVVPIGDFHNSSRSRDKKSDVCKRCAADYGRSWQRRNKKRVNAKNRRWYRLRKKKNE